MGSQTFSALQAPSKGLGSPATAIGLYVCKFTSVLLHVTLANDFLQCFFFTSLTTSHAKTPPIDCILRKSKYMRLLRLDSHFPTHHHPLRRCTPACALNHERLQATLAAVPQPSLQSATAIAGDLHELTAIAAASTCVLVGASLLPKHTAARFACPPSRRVLQSPHQQSLPPHSSLSRMDRINSPAAARPFRTHSSSLPARCSMHADSHPRRIHGDYASRPRCSQGQVAQAARIA